MVQKVSPDKPRIVFACESLVEGNGGISRVDRLITQVLREEALAGSLDVEHIVFCDGAASNVFVPWRHTCCNGSRLRFLIEVWYAAIRPGVFIYDTPYFARVHPMVLGLRRRYMVFFHGIEVWERCKSSWLRASRHADMLVTNSDYTRMRAEQLHRVFGRARVCWLSTEAGSEAMYHPESDEVRRVLIVGRMSREGYKGHRELILALPKVASSVGNVKLDIVGQGPLRPKLEQLVAETGVSKDVTFHGFMSEDELGKAYRKATVFAMPSRGEGFGLVYIEAMRHGIPVIASRHDAASEVVADGKTGLLVDLDKPDDLAEKLIVLLRNPVLRRRMGEAGLDRWKEHFTYPAFRSRFRLVLADLFSGHAATMPSQA